MSEKDRAVEEAEAFVRKAVAHFPDTRINETAIKAAAVKVSKTMPVKAKKSRF